MQTIRLGPKNTSKEQHLEE